ncbi:MAG: lipid A deacylase LpxR family protein [Methanomassiliicoccales archaeon]|jgi:hypothetical protein
MMKIKFLGIVASLCMSFSTSANMIGLSMENDLLNHSDANYTHGTRLWYVNDRLFNEISANQNILVGFLANCYSSRSKAIGLTLSQYIYTPEDISAKYPSYFDRPYAGWLYFGCMYMAYDSRNMDLWEIDAGIMGPHSYAEQVQKQIHRWTGSQIPQGWDTQLDDEIGLDLIYQKKYKVRWRDYFDVIPQGTLAWGNIHTYGSCGVSMRLGYNVPNDFGMFRMEPATKLAKSNRKSFGCYLIGSANGWYVIRNAMLDGNSWGGGRHVDKEIWVGEFGCGAGITLYGVDFIFMQNYRSKEFKTQNEAETYSTAFLSYYY